MKVKIEIDIKKCNDCPYYKWEADNSCSNHSGVSKCKKENKEIAWDDEYPNVPKWCPLK